MGAVCSCDDEDLVERNGDDEAPLAGRWVSGRGQTHVIGLHAIQWHSGDVTGYRKQRRRKGGYQYIVELNGTQFTASMTPEGHLQWNDGDVWRRDTDGPRTGTYAAISGALAPAEQMLKTATSFVVGAEGGGKKGQDSPGSVSTDVGTLTPNRGLSLGSSPASSDGPPRGPSGSPPMGKVLFGTPPSGSYGQPVSQASTQMASAHMGSPFVTQIQGHPPAQFQTFVPGYMTHPGSQVAGVGMLPPGVPMVAGTAMAPAGASFVPAMLPVDPAASAVPRPKRRAAPPGGAALLMPDR